MNLEKESALLTLIFADDTVQYRDRILPTGSIACMAMNIPKDMLEKYTDDKELENAVRAEVKNLSQKLTHYKRPNLITVVKEPLPRTTTRKVKRKEVKELVNV